MTGDGPTGQRTQESPESPTAPATSSAAARASRLSPANMARSLLPLVVVCLLVVGWFSWQQDGVDPVHPVETATTVKDTAARASYPLLVPVGLPSGYRSTSIRTNAGSVRPGGAVTLQIGYVTPSEQFAGFAESGNPGDDALTSVLDGAQRQGTVRLGGHTWTRSTTKRGETALSWQAGQVTVLVTGSASEKELETVAAAVQPYSG